CHMTWFLPYQLGAQFALAACIWNRRPASPRERLYPFRSRVGVVQEDLSRGACERSPDPGGRSTHRRARGCGQSFAGVTKRGCAPGAAGAAATHDELLGEADYATFCTLPLRMHEVHARRRRDAPFTTARTDCRFKSQRRLVTL